MKLGVLILALVAVTGVSAYSLDADCQRCQTSCNSCQAICRPHAEIKKIKKTCFDVECEQICIPAIRFPWQKCREPQCGRVITVHRLKKREYDCGEKCVTKWNIECSCGRCTGGCADTQATPDTPMTPDPQSVPGSKTPPPAPPAPETAQHSDNAVPTARRGGILRVLFQR